MMPPFSKFSSEGKGQDVLTVGTEKSCDVLVLLFVPSVVSMVSSYTQHDSSPIFVAYELLPSFPLFLPVSLDPDYRAFSSADKSHLKKEGFILAYSSGDPSHHSRECMPAEVGGATSTVAIVKKQVAVNGDCVHFPRSDPNKQQKLSQLQQFDQWLRHISG